MEPSTVQQGELRLLYVEDEPETRELIAAELAAEYPGLSLYTAGDGAQGLALFREYRPQVVVTDIRMPVMDGLQMAGEMIAIDPETELVALTAYSETSFLMGAIEIGFSHYVLKPIDYDRLFAAIRKSLAVVELKRRVQEQNEQLREFATELEGKVEERTRELEESREALQRKNEKLREITGRLKRARDRYWSLYNWSPLGYLSLDDNCVIREINITGAHMLGARRAELRDTCIERYLSAENVAALTAAFQQCSREEASRAELEICLGEGKFLYVHLHCLPYKEEADRRLYRTALVDITKLKEAEEKLRQSERLLMEQGRMAAMGEMLTNISHHWRQPLNVLGLQIQTLEILHQHGTLTREALCAHVAEGMQVLKDLSHSIDVFLSFADPEKVTSVFNPADAVAKACSLVEERLKARGIALEVQAGEDLQVAGDINDYVQVLLNLLTNAAEAYEGTEPERPRILLRLRGEEGKTVATVTDNAGGIGAEILGRIFDPFFTTKRLGMGSGIGLFLSRMVVEKKMGGRLSVRNVEGGAEFSVEV